VERTERSPFVKGGEGLERADLELRRRPVATVGGGERRGAGLFLVLAAALTACLPARPFDEARWRAAVEATRESELRAPHRDADGKFFNPWMPQERSPWDFWRWKLSRRGAVAEAAGSSDRAPSEENPGAYLSAPAGEPSVTHVGHATFAVHWGGPVVVTDPFFSRRAAIVERRVPPAFGPERVPDGSVVVISHNHYDHLDADSVAALAERATFLCPVGLGEFLRGHGAVRVREMDWWEETEVGGTRFVCLPAQHWSRRLGQGYNETLWCSWLLERDGRRVYFGADSGYFKGFREFGRRFPGIDVALLPIGAFEPRWFMHYPHMDIQEVLRAFEELGAARLVPTQWGVMQLGDEPAAWPATALRREVDGRPGLGDRVVGLPVGGRLFFGGEG